MILIIWAHPDPQSLTATIAQSVESALAQSEVDIRSIDLYRVFDGGPFPAILEFAELRRKTSFDSSVQMQMTLVEQASDYVVVHPDWWGGPPAVLKGWIDRVLRPGTGYEIPEAFGHNEAQGLLGGRRASVIISGDSDDAGPLEEFWTDRIWKFCGVESRLFYLSRVRDRGRKEREALVKNATKSTLEFLRS